MKLLITFFRSQQKVPRDAALQSSHKPTFKKAISQNAQIIVKQSMFALAKRGAGAEPLQKKRCHSEAASADSHAAEESRAAPIYKGGAVPVRSVLM